MAAASSSLSSPSSSLLSAKPHAIQRQPQQISLLKVSGHSSKASKRQDSLRVQAAKLPAGVELPKVEPKFQASVVGFTRVAEIWNSRACMIGLIGTFIIELILNKGILQMIGVDVGKGLDLPL